MTLTALRTAWLQQLEKHRAIAVIRAATPAVAYRMASTVAASGMQLIEITWTTPQASQIVAQLRADFPHHCIGAGTILSIESLQQAAEAGAQFIFSPHMDTTLIQASSQYQIPMVPGALSPSEIVAAWRAGAASVKVFPVGAVGGAAYIEALRGPLGHIPLVPSGGVTADGAAAFLKAGAAAIGLSTALFPQAALETESWGEVVQRVLQLSEQIEPLCVSAVPTKQAAPS
ncbi:MAG: bifunctional 4-hydroxy-2-oxoglutarate aldolase/2-dehydro-3-deoxy-phosphogluconate aldolase [Elainellaceae cyanobacterium]